MRLSRLFAHHVSTCGRCLVESFETIAARLREGMEATNDARERALKECREIVRGSSRAIRAVHRRNFEDARTMLLETRQRVEGVKRVLTGHPSLYHAGYVHDSQ